MCHTTDQGRNVSCAKRYYSSITFFAMCRLPLITTHNHTSGHLLIQVSVVYYCVISMTSPPPNTVTDIIRSPHYICAGGHLSPGFYTPSFSSRPDFKCNFNHRGYHTVTALRVNPSSHYGNIIRLFYSVNSLVTTRSIILFKIYCTNYVISV